MKEQHIDYEAFADLFDHAVMILEMEKSGNYHYKFLNKAACNAFGSVGMLHKTPEEVLSPDEASIFIQKSNEAVSRQTSIIYTHSHNDMMLETKISPLADAKENSSYIVVISKDVTAEKQQEQKLKYLEDNDPFTKLPNKALLETSLRQSIAHNQKNESMLALLYIDLDGFQEINDYLGLNAGDRFLLEAVKRMHGCFEEEQMLARVSSQGFVLLLSDISDQETALKCAESVVAAFKDPFHELQPGFRLRSSVGISFYSGNDTTKVTELLKQAELAMYMVKKRQYSNYTIYNNEMQFTLDRQLSLESEIEKALRNKAFFLEYQPIINIKTNEVTSVEALIRWNHESFGVLPPSHFIALAEKTDMIYEMGEWVLRNACLQLKQWQKEGLPSFKISVNISISQLLMMERFIDTVKAVLKETGIFPEQLELEVTEKIFKDNIESIYIILEELHDLGIQISIDDFGAGNSSINILKYLPVDTIKIDRSFMQHVEKGSRNFSFLKSITTLAKELNITTVMERIETKDQLTVFTKEDGDLVQGYYLCPPLSPEKLAASLTELTTLKDIN